MTSSIDNRVVSMTFDNAAFERKLSDTLKSLDNLRKSLDFANSKKSLQDLGKATDNFNMKGFGGAIDGVSAKFLALSTIGITVLSKITSKAIDTGSRILKAFSITPILDGFREYETNMNSIQTILANTDSKGTSLEQVNAALDQLNTYADQTIYNFAEMTRNIGTFTAAGVDLDTSVSAIKGIANLAAISGSNSQQASTAMYQLSQALASGTVKLMDWNSVVNAGMGGEVFQKALFETGKALKTIPDVPISETFDEWKDKGNSFRNSLESGWITAEVLTNTLQGFTGDLSDAQLLSLGYTQDQVTELQRLGKVGKAAATEVKTITQLMDTVAEAVGSGWSSSFRIILGDFNEAKELLSRISDGFGTAIGASADARNALLQGWKDLGGRTLLIKAFSDAIAGIGSIIKPIKEAFREIFPKTTAKQLFAATQAFADFTAKIKIGEKTAAKIKRAFQGFFSIFSIGKEILSQFVKLILTFTGGASDAAGDVLNTAAKAGDSLTKLRDALVDGGAIKRFFDRMGKAIRVPLKFIRELKENVAGFFSRFKKDLPSIDGVDDALEKVSVRFDHLSGSARKVAEAWGWVVDKFRAVGSVLDEVWNHISTWFGELGDKMAKAMKPSDFDAAVDVVNVGLLGGILAVLGKFLHSGFKFDIGNGLIENIVDTFEELTGTLKAMQTDLRASALLKIAGAVALLTASVLVLSTINSASLTKALVAMSVGFGQLVGALALIEKVSLGASAAKLVIISGAMILIAGAMLLLSVAIKNLSSLGWEEMAKGLIGVGVGLAILTKATTLIASDTAGLVRAGAAMIVISLGLWVLSKAVGSFAELSWGELAKGLTAIAVSLAVLVTAMNKMPTAGMVQAGIGIVAIAVGLKILATAVEDFAGISWGDMAHGLVGIAGALAVVVTAMRFMPPNMVSTAASMVLIGVALNIMAIAVEKMGKIDLGSLAKGIGAIGILLVTLAFGTSAMVGALPGAAALVVVSGSLLVLAKVLKVIGRLSFGELIKGLGGIAATLALLAVAAALLQPVIPAMLALGGALALIGLGFALFGVGAALVAKAFEVLARVGKESVEIFIQVLEKLIGALPRLAIAFFESLMSMVQTVLEAAPVLIKAFTVILGHILESVIELAPQVAQAFVAVVLGALDAIIKLYPKVVETAYTVLTAFLRGLRDNFSEVVTLMVDMMIILSQTVLDNADKLVNAGIDILLKFLKAIADRAREIAAAGLNMLKNFLRGISENISEVTKAAAAVIVEFIRSAASKVRDIIEAGVALLVAFLRGIGENLSKVTKAVADVIIRFVGAMGENAVKIARAGTDALIDFLDGIGENLWRVTRKTAEVVSSFITEVGKSALKIAKAGGQALIDFLSGVDDEIDRVATAAVDVVTEFLDAIDDNALRIIEAGADMIIDFLNGLATIIDQKSHEFRQAGAKVGIAIADGMSFGLASKAQSVINKAVDIARRAMDAVTGFLGINSPSKRFMEIGQGMGLGLGMGLDQDTRAVSSAEKLAKRTTEGFQKSLSRFDASTFGLDDLSPVVSPVLDLTGVESGAAIIDKLFKGSTITPDVSLARAKAISTTTDLTNDQSQIAPAKGPSEVKFEQNIYAPSALTTNDIYRNTKSQIALAKEELAII